MVVHHGDCLDVLRTMSDNSIDSVVTDPPYGISFMQRHWDYDLPSVELWREVLRVLKPGGHLLSFGGTRTYHRLASAIEDAGFEIRDQLQWIFGSGFPKSMDVSKAIDKAAGAEREVVGQKKREGGPVGRRFVNLTTLKQLQADGITITPDGRSVDIAIQQSEKFNTGFNEVTAPSTEDARTWSGWGTALKPANEPIVLARKPLGEKTVAKNVLKHGTGALNIDASRIGMQPAKTYTTPDITGDAYNSEVAARERKTFSVPAQGRWPANVLFDEDAAEVLDGQSGISRSQAGGASGSNANPMSWTQGNKDRPRGGHTDTGGASRFFYVAKTSKRERNAGLEGMPEVVKPLMGEFKDNPGRTTPKCSPTARANHHPTVKPLKLMEYLIRLITPPGGTVLDPFTGSGSTGVASKRLGFDFVGIEREADYVEIARKRIDHA